MPKNPNRFYSALLQPETVLDDAVERAIAKVTSFREAVSKVGSFPTSQANETLKQVLNTDYNVLSIAQQRLRDAAELTTVKNHENPAEEGPDAVRLSR